MAKSGYKASPWGTVTAAGRKANAKAKRAARSAAMRAVPSTARTGGYSFQSTGGKELNFVDTSFSASTIAGAGSISLLNGMAQGTTASTRIGRRILMKSVECRFSVYASNQADTYRVALLYDKQANAAAPAFTDIYDVANPQSLRNISNKARFMVVHDFGLNFVAGDGSAAAYPIGAAFERTHEFYKKFSIPVQYNNGTAGTVGDIQTNAFYLVAISTSGHCAMSGYVRVRYSDE